MGDNSLNLAQGHLTLALTASSCTKCAIQTTQFGYTHPFLYWFHHIISRRYRHDFPPTFCWNWVIDDTTAQPTGCAEWDCMFASDRDSLLSLKLIWLCLSQYSSVNSQLFLKNINVHLSHLILFHRIARFTWQFYYMFQTHLFKHFPGLVLSPQIINGFDGLLVFV